MAPHSHSPDDLAPAKQAMRRMMRARRAEASKAHETLHGEALIRHGLSAGSMGGVAWRGACVSIYLPIRTEIDPRGLMEALRLAGARLALPRVEGGDLTFRMYEPDTILEAGPFGLLEPTEASPEVSPILMFAPLLAFDRRGGRLGYGAGYYDRAIARYRPKLVIGLAYAAQEVEAVPADENDRRLDLVATERGVIDCRAAARS